MSVKLLFTNKQQCMVHNGTTGVFSTDRYLTTTMLSLSPVHYRNSCCCIVVVVVVLRIFKTE